MKYLACATLGVALALLPAALAQPPEAQETPLEEPALDLEALGDLRGGDGIVVQHTTQTLTANNSGNTINGNSIDSGAMNINANAFNGYDGIGNFVINTGHNNNLMGSVSVNVMVTPQ